MKRKNILIVLIIVLATFFTGTFAVNAITNAPDKMTVTHTELGIGNNPLNINNNFSIKKTTDGKFVYCMDINLSRPLNIVYNKVSDKPDAGVAYIVNSGYYNKTNSDYFITQSALWLYLEDMGMMKQSTVTKNLRTSVYSSANNSNQVAVDIRNLVMNAKRAKFTSGPYLEFTTNQIYFELSDDKTEYISNVIKVNTNLDSYDVKFENAPDGLSYTKSNNKITIYIPANEVVGEYINFKINISGEKTQYQANIYEPVDNKYQPVVVPFLDKISLSDSLVGSLSVDSTTVSISKQDITTKKELEGATLVLKNSSGDIVEAWVSSTKPHVIYNLPIGKYTLSETKAPDGYKLSTETITFEITENGVEKNIVMYNDVVDEPEEEIEVPVEPTSSFAPMSLSIIGIIIIAIGSIFIYKNVKTNER